MKIGFLTVALGELEFDEIARWAHSVGFESLEVAVWPPTSDRDYFSTTIDVENFTEGDAENIKRILEENELMISAFAYYDNNLDTDLKKRKMINDHLKKAIDAASMLGVELVGTFVGRDITKSVEENLKEFEVVFKPLIAYAERKNVKLMIENCPMVGWQKKGEIGNIFYSPQIWREVFRITPDSFGLNLDPSHLYWLGIDYISVIKEFGNRIFHAHAKDVELNESRLYEQGIYGHWGTNENGKSWWTYRLPGFGEIDWGKLVLELRKIGYDYVLSIEHEDPVWEGSEEKAKKGLTLGLKFLRKVV